MASRSISYYTPAQHKTTLSGATSSVPSSDAAWHAEETPEGVTDGSHGTEEETVKSDRPDISSVDDSAP